MLSFNSNPYKTNKKQTMPPLINPLPFVFIFATAFGVVMHDTKVDHATSVAVVAPVDASLASAVSKTDDHTHVERASVSGQEASTHNENVPKTQARNDHNRYIQGKKGAINGGNENGLWPSV
jgi:hypothetical protein